MDCRVKPGNDIRTKPRPHDVSFTNAGQLAASLRYRGATRLHVTGSLLHVGRMAVTTDVVRRFFKCQVPKPRDIRTLRPLPGFRIFPYECGVLSNHSKGSLLAHSSSARWRERQSCL